MEFWWSRIYGSCFDLPHHRLEMRQWIGEFGSLGGSKLVVDFQHLPALPGVHSSLLSSLLVVFFGNRGSLQVLLHFA